MDFRFCRTRAAILHFAAAVLLSMAVAASALAADKPPAVGEPATDFKLTAIDGGEIQISKVHASGPVVLVVLRGFPGYQCPICNVQVGDLIAAASKLKAHQATVVLVYPGPSDNLQARASEFVSGKRLPANFHLVLDPDYAFTNAYHLRWNAKNETAYPATFVIDKDGKIRFAKVSMTHGDRAKTADVLAALASL